MLTAVVVVGKLGNSEPPSVVASLRSSIMRALCQSSAMAFVEIVTTTHAAEAAIAHALTRTAAVDAPRPATLLLYCIGDANVKQDELLLPMGSGETPPLNVFAACVNGAKASGQSAESLATTRTLIVGDSTCLDTPSRNITPDSLRSTANAASMPFETATLFAAKRGDATGAGRPFHEVLTSHVVSVAAIACSPQSIANAVANDVPHLEVFEASQRATLMNLDSAPPANKRGRDADGEELMQPGRAQPADSYWCEVCHCSVSGSGNWEQHIASARHLRKAESLPAGAPLPSGKTQPAEGHFWCQACQCSVSGHGNWEQHLASARHQRKVVAAATASAGADATQLLVAQNSANYFNCDICDTIISGEQNIQQHVNGAKHRSRAAQKGIAL